MQDAPNELVKLFSKLETQMIKEISKNIAENAVLMEDDEYRLRLMQEMGYDLRKIEREISRTNEVGQKEIEKILTEGTELSYDNDRKFYLEGGKRLPPIDSNPALIDFIEGIIRNAKTDLSNMTNTLGVVDKGTFMGYTDYYRQQLGYASLQVGTGAYDLNTVLEQTVRTLGVSGIRTIDYNSGRTYHIDSAVRMNVLTSLNQITGQMSTMNADMMGQDLMEITAHMGARPSHAEWQGKIVSRTGRQGYLTLDDIGYGEATGFQGVNCRHGWFPFFEGISEPAYTERHLESLDKEFEYEGKTYTTYEATQKQRYMERQMKDTKRRWDAAESAGLDDIVQAMRIKLRRQEQEYERFSNIAELRPKWERTTIY